MARFKNTTPDSQKVAPGYLHFIIKSKLNFSRPNNQVHETEKEFKRVINEFTKSVEGDHGRIVNLRRGRDLIITYHGRNRNGAEYPHCHIAYYHTKDCIMWKHISHLLRRSGYKYEWSTVRSLCNLAEYLQEGECREVLVAQTGPRDIQRQPGVYDSDDDGEEVPRGNELSQHHVQHGESSVGAGYTFSEPGGESSDDDSGSVQRQIGGETKTDRAVSLLYKAIQTIQPASVSTVKEVVYTNKEQWLPVVRLLTQKEFIKWYQAAYDEVTFSQRLMPWEKLLAKVNMASLIARNGQYLTVNSSVSWIKEWCTHNDINIKVRGSTIINHHCLLYK